MEITPASKNPETHMRHRDAEFLPPAVLEDALARAPYEHYVVWTGHVAASRPGSLRSRAFGCVAEVGVPLKLREVLHRAARLTGEWGLHPDLVRAAIRGHQAAKPCVYLLVERLGSGDFVAVTDIPFAGFSGRRVRAGELLMGRCGSLQIELLAEHA